MATAKSSTTQTKINGTTMSVVDALAHVNAMPDSALLSTSEAAVFLRASVSKLERMRRDQIGPPYVAGGQKNSVAYMKDDLKAWLVSIQTEIPMAKGIQPSAKPTAAAVAQATLPKYFLPDVPDAMTIKSASGNKASGKK